jgi:hypothetical protein
MSCIFERGSRRRVALQTLKGALLLKFCKEYFTDRITLSEISTGSGR